MAAPSPLTAAQHRGAAAAEARARTTAGRGHASCRDQGRPAPAAAPVQGKPTPPAAAPVPGPAAAPAADDGPLLITNPRFRAPPQPPVYPRGARDQGQEGEVLVRARLDLAGNPEDVAVERSSGFDLLDRAALAAVRRWAFEPGRRGGQSVASWVRIPVRFSLR